MKEIEKERKRNADYDLYYDCYLGTSGFSQINYDRSELREGEEKQDGARERFLEKFSGWRFFSNGTKRS